MLRRPAWIFSFSHTLFADSILLFRTQQAEYDKAMMEYIVRAGCFAIMFFYQGILAYDKILTPKAGTLLLSFVVGCFANFGAWAGGFQAFLGALWATCMDIIFHEPMFRIGVVAVVLFWSFLRLVSADAHKRAVTAVVDFFAVFCAMVDVYLALASAPLVMSKNWFWHWKLCILIPTLSLSAGLYAVHWLDTMLGTAVPLILCGRSD
jgi:hypothetical protein